MRRGFKTWAEDQALAQRRLLDLSAQDPLTGAELAEKHRLRIISIFGLPGISQDVVKQLTQVDPQSWSAFTVSYAGRGLIVTNPSHSVKRTASDVMHELAHRVCGHSQSQVVALIGTDLFLREYKQDDEDEAAWLGGCLLVPRQALLWSIRQGMSTRDIGDKYCASDELIAYRINVTGVQRQLKARKGVAF